MSILMKVEAGYVTAQCRHTVIYLKSPVGGRVGAERLITDKIIYYFTNFSLDRDFISHCTKYNNISGALKYWTQKYEIKLELHNEPVETA